MRSTDLCFDHSKTGYQGFEILKNKFGVRKRFVLLHEGIEVGKITVIYPGGRSAAVLCLRHIEWYVDVQAEGIMVYGKGSMW